MKASKFTDAQKAFIIKQCGYEFEPKANPDRYWIDVYYVGSMRELAEQFVEEGLYGEIPETLQHYIDYDAIARDLGMEYSELSVAGEYLIYRAS